MPCSSTETDHLPRVPLPWSNNSTYKFPSRNAACRVRHAATARGAYLSTQPTMMLHIKTAGKHKIVACGFFLQMAVMAVAQLPPGVQWHVMAGGGDYDGGQGITATLDGGGIVVGWTMSNDGDAIGQHGQGDILAIKLDEHGNIQWHKDFGRSEWETSYSITSCGQDGFSIIGTTSSTDGDAIGVGYGGIDIWKFEINDIGEIASQRKYGSSQPDAGYDLSCGDESNVLILGATSKADGVVTINHGLFDYWLSMVNPQGELLWQNAYGGTSDDIPFAFTRCADGGFVLVGKTSSNNGDVSGYHGGSADGWVVKVNNAGTMQWQRALGGSRADVLYDVCTTDDGGCVVVGYTSSRDGDVSGGHGTITNEDGWAVKLDNAGNIIWQHALGGSANDHLTSVVALSDGGFMAVGYSWSSDGDVPYSLGGKDGWVLKLDATGNLVWSMVLGGSADDQFWKVIRTSDGGFLLGGSSTSNDGDATGNHGMEDMWVVKLGPEPAGILEREPALPLAVYPNPAVEEAHLQFTLRAGGTVRLEVLNLAGQTVLPPVEMHKPPGLQDVALPTGALPPGAYQVRIITPEGAAARQLVKVR